MGGGLSKLMGDWLPKAGGNEVESPCFSAFRSRPSSPDPACARGMHVQASQVKFKGQPVFIQSARMPFHLNTSVIIAILVTPATGITNNRVANWMSDGYVP